MYISGIHVIETLELCQNYLKRFKRQDNKIIVVCAATGCVPKPRGKKGVLLADEITILFEYNCNEEFEKCIYNYIHLLKNIVM